MTKYENRNKVDERFIVTYGKHKVQYLREKGFFYLFSGFNTNSCSQFWVYDNIPEIRKALDNYISERIKIENDR